MTSNIALNDAQRAAVTAPDGPALVLAGAGSGKTRVIVERLAWLVEERGIDPRNLLALTFTNRAAGEMRQRLAERLELERVSAWMGTFHSFGLFILRREIDRLGRSKSFTICDDADQLSLMKRLVKALPDAQQSVTPREALRWIGDLKQRCETPDAEPESERERTYATLWKQYHATLAQSEALDFDDMLVLLVELLREHVDIRERYQNRYKYVLIDEYQDTNRAQYLIARQLTAGHRNLFVVGDEDQSIYSWRGADINNILDFAADFGGAETYRLEQNFRSTQPVLDAANAVVANNLNRLGKTLWTNFKKGERVGFYHAEDAEAEARWIVDDMSTKQLSPRETAVLYRTNGQARLFEEALRAKGQAYRVVGGIKFYSRKEIKDVIAYLRLLVNPSDDESLRRVLNVPARGIGGATAKQIEDYAAARRVPIFQVLRDIELDETLSARARKSATEFVQLVDDLAIEAKTEPVAEVVEHLIDRSGYREFVERSDEKDFRTRLENLDEFISACADRDRRAKRPLIEFLQELALLSDVDEYEAEAPTVTLMTCHSAKGLEFDHVYLAGLEEGLLPFVHGDDEERDVEEERRLCYVAMTRARKTLTLSAAETRTVYGRRESRRVSRFVEEAGRDRLNRLSKNVTVKQCAAQAAPIPEGGPKSGTRVRHARFGNGTISYTSGSGANLKAHIRFDTGRLVKLMLNKAPIEILEGRRR